MRLPLSDEQVLSVLDSYTGDKESTNAAMQKTILSIGMPVTGDDLSEVGLEVVHAHGTDLTYCREHAQRIANGADGIIYSLVRQSDHIAKLAEKDAEIVRKDAEIERLWAALEGIEVSIDALPDDNEDYSRMSAREMQRQALEVVKAEVKALKGTEA
ncbi:hypothetical protein AD947_03110 [Acetobacter tropicalis]|uniref:Uncharacterized protein n=1 Tax=Acetobacter tropicalis TaxID=104102 RepID=A0A149U3B6_9PROT|nr:hypothetical protein AD947_03110 [Acetobacter tropicalis]